MKQAMKCVNGLRGLAISGFGTEQDESASRQAGFSLHLVKPISVRLLLEAICAVLSIHVG